MICKMRVSGDDYMVQSKKHIFCQKISMKNLAIDITIKCVLKSKIECLID